jgi:hypothetical protein
MIASARAGQGFLSCFAKKEEIFDLIFCAKRGIIYKLS